MRKRERGTGAGRDKERKRKRKERQRERDEGKTSPLFSGLHATTGDASMDTSAALYPTRGRPRLPIV